jgi:hypothetical protein
MQNHASTIYAYASLAALLEGEEQGGPESVLSRSIGLPSRKTRLAPDRLLGNGQCSHSQPDH